MNNCIFSGRLTKDIELKKTASGKVVGNFSLAVDRDYVNADGTRAADFLPMIVWDKLAETMAKYLGKGRKVLVNTRCQTRTYDAQDGSKRYVTEFIVQNFEFCDSKPSASAVPAPVPIPTDADAPAAEPAPHEEMAVSEEDLPF